MKTKLWELCGEVKPATVLASAARGEAGDTLACTSTSTRA
ncbi:hypothetical protein DAD186_04650 [Dermabacter vaginalis]|uniref:Uncharacterized protein n=1 Tax=Dermabacter vaginalis TaxID=1630135 RepID=A0A1B0ZGF3_9MICO|nr:hypothetical protein DAD186_04650 [Dermabacter vaginalis]